MERASSISTTLAATEHQPARNNKDENRTTTREEFFDVCTPGSEDAETAACVSTEERLTAQVSGSIKHCLVDMFEASGDSRSIKSGGAASRPAVPDRKLSFTGQQSNSPQRASDVDGGKVVLREYVEYRNRRVWRANHGTCSCNAGLLFCTCYQEEYNPRFQILESSRDLSQYLLDEE